MSNREALLKALADGDEWRYQESADALYVAWYAVDSDTPIESRVLWSTVDNVDPATVLAACKAGFDVDHITRITGYFSKTNGWNKGKKAELQDRARVTVAELLAETKPVKAKEEPSPKEATKSCPKEPKAAPTGQ
jgi:hypothetical protein